MSTSPLTPIPPPHGFSQCAVKLDKATPAALRYLTGDAIDSLDAWDHLIGICYNFVGDLFLKDDFGDYVVEGVHHNELTGKRNSHYQRREGTASITRNWIQEWLLGRLNSYHGKPPAEIQAAADRGEFRYLGRQCRNALIDRLRMSERDTAPQIVSLDSVDDDGGNAESTGSLADTIGTWNTGGQSSFHSPTCSREDLIEFINENSDLDWVLDLSAFVDVFCPADDAERELGKGDVTRLIAERRGVSEHQARGYKRRLLESAKSGRLWKLFRVLRPAEGPRAGFVQAAESQNTRAKKRLRSQALEEMVEFAQWCRESGIKSNSPTSELHQFGEERKGLTRTEL
jgi:hypothetical protein